MAVTEAYTQTSWRKKLYEVIYEADTPAGKLFDVILLLVIVASIVLVMLESVPKYGALYGSLFLQLEWIITVFFTIEFFLRIVSVKKPLSYVFSFYGIIDLISTLPLYIGIFLSGGVSGLIAIRSLRLLRVFRILKIGAFVGESDKLKQAIKSSSTKISVFLFAVIILCIIFGTLMYIIEGAESGFVSIPVSIYWCIVTLTTVGYGDIAPQTPIGQFIASFIMIIGYGIIAVPTGIVTSELALKSNNKIDDLNTQSCPSCLAQKHNANAKFCHNCGSNLDDH